MSSLLWHLRSSCEACLLNDGMPIARLSHTLMRCPSPSPSPSFNLSFTTKLPHLSCLILLRPSLWTRSSVGLHGPGLCIAPPLWSHWKPCPCIPSIGKTWRVSEREPAISAVAIDSCGFDSDSSNSEEEEEVNLHDAGGDERRSEESYWVVNFYVLVDIEDPELEVARHRCFLKDKDIHGRIYISSQGINAQYSGPREDVLAYAEWVRQDPRFSSLYKQVSPSIDGHAFPRLKLQNKPSLVQVEGGTSCLPITDPASRAIPLNPQQWRKKLESAQKSNIMGDQSTRAKENSCCQIQREILLLDDMSGMLDISKEHNDLKWTASEVLNLDSKTERELRLIHWRMLIRSTLMC